MSILITICARGGSKGIPGKNTKLLNGIPLLHYTLNTAKEFSRKYQADIQLSTDDIAIKDCAKQLKYETKYVRPKKLSLDTAGKIDTIRHAWQFAEKRNNCKYDLVLDLDVTSPLRNLKDLSTSLEIILTRPDALNLFSVNKAERNPYFNMVEETGNGFMKLVKDGYSFKSRQEAPKVYDMNASFYFFSRKFMTGNYPISITERSLIYLMPHICFDLDHPNDFTIMELLIKNNLLDFEL